MEPDAAAPLQAADAEASATATSEESAPAAAAEAAAQENAFMNAIIRARPPTWWPGASKPTTPSQTTSSQRPQTGHPPRQGSSPTRREAVERPPDAQGAAAEIERLNARIAELSPHGPAGPADA